MRAMRAGVTGIEIEYDRAGTRGLKAGLVLSLPAHGADIVNCENERHGTTPPVGTTGPTSLGNNMRMITGDGVDCQNGSQRRM